MVNWDCNYQQISFSAKARIDLSVAYCSGYRHRCRKYLSSYATAMAVEWAMEWATKEPLTTRPPAESL